MKLIHDGSAYEEKEMALMKAIVSSIITDLKVAGLRGDKLYNTVLKISFSLSTAIDGSDFIEFHDEYLVPVLTFAEGRMRDKLLSPTSGGSSLHEFAPGIVKELLGPEKQIKQKPPS